MTGGRSAFARRDLVEALAAAHGRGGSVERIEGLVDRLIASDHIVALEGGEAGAAIRTAGGRRIGRVAVYVRRGRRYELAARSSKSLKDAGVWVPKAGSRP